MRTVTQVQHTSCGSVLASTMPPPRPVPAVRSTRSAQTTKPKSYWGFKSLEVDQSATAPIFIDFNYPPLQSPSVAIDESLPPTVIKRGGVTKRGKYPCKKRLDNRKGKPHKAECLRLIREQNKSGTLHLRPYVLNARWPVTEVAVPTARDLLRPQRRQLPNGLWITYRLIDSTYVSNPPADPLAATTPEAIRHWFRTAREEGKYNQALLITDLPKTRFMLQSLKFVLQRFR